MVLVQGYLLSSHLDPCFHFHPTLFIPTLLFCPPPCRREVSWGGGFGCLYVDTSQQQFSPTSPEKTIAGPLVTLSGTLVLSKRP